MTSILPDLAWRGLVADMANREELERLLAPGAPPVTLYVGFDPSADSLHLGSLIPILLLRRFQRAGHRVIALAGGATGMIGDPSGKSAERNLLSVEVLEANIASIQGQLTHLLDSEDKMASVIFLNNADWIKPVGLLEFLRDIGKHFTVNAMVAKESVKQRMEGAGISFTEFSYPLIQAFDYLHIHETYGCELQAGGADQWGNITAGIDLIRRKHGRTVCGLTWPLLTKADGREIRQDGKRRGLARCEADERLPLLPVSRPGGGRAGDAVAALVHVPLPGGNRGAGGGAGGRAGTPRGRAPSRAGADAARPRRRGDERRHPRERDSLRRVAGRNHREAIRGGRGRSPQRYAGALAFWANRVRRCRICSSRPG